jgi:hypothetical protein|tara:strand:- start:307 stop:522 length:216 start_codon:yes stop_codon:yes gene_type:complete
MNTLPTEIIINILNDISNNIEKEIIKYERKLNRYEKMHDFLRIVFKNDKDNINFYILNKHFGNKLLNKEST